MLRALLPLLGLLAVATGAGVAGSSGTSPAPPADPARPLPFHYDLYTFRGDAGRTTVVAAFAVPVKGLEARREEWADRYRFDVTFVVADTALSSVSRSDDSVVVRVPRGLEGDHLLHTHVEVRTAPSGTTLQRIGVTDANTPGRGQLYTSPFPVRDYRGSRLMLSDIALGLPDAGGGWTRGDVTLALLPTSQFPESSFDVYYEVYNLGAGHRYATEISIEHLSDEHGRPVRDGRVVNLGFAGEVPPDRTGGTLPELRRVDTSLSEGRYRLTVTVTDRVTGERAHRSRFFHVRGWGPGATLVPALPRGGRTAS